MTTTDRLSSIATATNAGKLPTGLAAINGFVRAVAGDLPDPGSITVHNFSDDVNMLFDSLDDLREWAAYLQVQITPNAVPAHATIHHRAEATWGPVNGKMVLFRMVHIEDVPPHACSDDCDPGNCEVQHHAAFDLPRDCESGEWS